MVFQSFALLPYRSVLENVLFRFRYLGSPAGDGGRARARECIEAMGLSEVMDQPAHLLSGGEMQRLAIARAVVLPTRLLVADEPTGNLDSTSTARVMACFRQLNRERGITVLLATHNPALLDCCNRRVVCRDGHLEEAA
jgi:putative ABC transport system ATP-binding protein